MNSSVLLVLATSLTTAVPSFAANPFDQALNAPADYIVRGQDVTTSGPMYATGPLTVPPPGTTTFYPPETFGDPNAAIQGGIAQPYSSPGAPSYPTPITQDPWAGGMIAPIAPSNGYGVFGPQPQQFGWNSRIDGTWLPSSGTSSPNVGDVEIWAIDVEEEYLTPGMPGDVWTFGPQFNWRSIQGPTADDPTRDLPGSFFRFGLDLALQRTGPRGCTFEFGFTPAIATDLDTSLNSDSFQFDGRVVAYVPVSPQWQWVIGAAYWDRVDDIVIPYAGAVWTPNDLWEFRLLFPTTRASVFLGTPNGVPTWMYVEGEYHVESYQTELTIAGNTSDAKVQFSDYRLVGGFRWEAGWVTTFAEGGYAFNREVKYTSPGRDFDIDGQFIGRVGFRF
ncbi:hypothetical protein AB1L42_13575 [Thalassoglobus sp. JC818]|uniref:hypothetical protein n=1 Tax=Thalassoglobus sp. JC818 TaxID=3232136 RepID=UPI003459A45A